MKTGSLLPGQRQQIITNSACSEWRQVTTGLPQGSILGPLLFLIFVNNLPAVVQHCTISLYADDTSIYVSNTNPSTVGVLLEEDLKHWLECNGLKINVDKTQVMVLCGHRKSDQEDQVQVNIGTTVLKKQTSVKYLGVTVDNHLRWHAHIDNVRKGCLGKIAAIRRACHCLPSHIKRTLYQSFSSIFVCTLFSVLTHLSSVPTTLYMIPLLPHAFVLVKSGPSWKAEMLQMQHLLLLNKIMHDDDDDDDDDDKMALNRRCPKIARCYTLWYSLQWSVRLPNICGEHQYVRMVSNLSTSQKIISATLPLSPITLTA